MKFKCCRELFINGTFLGKTFNWFRIPEVRAGGGDGEAEGKKKESSALFEYKCDGRSQTISFRLPFSGRHLERSYPRSPGAEFEG